MAGDNACCWVTPTQRGGGAKHPPPPPPPSAFGARSSDGSPSYNASILVAPRRPTTGHTPPRFLPAGGVGELNEHVWVKYLTRDNARRSIQSGLSSRAPADRRRDTSAICPS